MEIHNKIKIKDLALEYKNNLILADFHIGFEEALNKQGVLVPRIGFEQLLKRLRNILTKKYDKIIINGDIKHEFGTISDTEWRHTLLLLDYLSDFCKKIILVKGNHDTILGPIAKKRNIEIVDFYKIDDITILHGHKIIPNLSKTLIIGHEHPAISFKQRPDEKFKCFLKGKYKSHNLIVQPSFNLVTQGSDIKKESLLSPFLQQNLDNFEVFVIEDKTYNFGKLKNLEQKTF